MSLPWVEVYRPQSRKDLVGNEASINGLYLFLSRWTIDFPIKVALLLGPAGCGKTSSVYALANELGFTVLEVNASDTRKKSSIQEILAPATQFSDLSDLGQRKIILMDEIDGLSGQYDRGGLSEFIKIIQSTRFPIIATANDPESNNIAKLQKRKEIRTFNFSRLDEFEILELLSRIVDQKNLAATELELEGIAASAAGDIRAAINELESHSSGSSNLQLEERNKMKSLVNIINDIYRSKNYHEARSAVSNSPSDYYMMLLFLFDETAAQCRTSEELSLAYSQLAEADLVYNRIMRTQNWSLLKYFFDFIGPGVTLARKNNQFKRINSLKNIPSSFISRGKAKSINSKAIQVAPKVSKKLHVSETEFINRQFRLFHKIILGNKGSEIAAWLDLDDSDADVLSKGYPDSDLAINFEEAKIKIGQIRAIEGKSTKSSFSQIEQYFLDISEGSEDMEEVVEQEQEESEDVENETQLSLDDFF